MYKLVLKKLDQILIEAQTALQKITNKEALVLWRQKFLGRNSVLKPILETFKDISHSERIKQGKLINVFKTTLTKAFDEKQAKLILALKTKKLAQEKIDPTIDLQPFFKHETGGRHPISIVVNQIKTFFSHLGYEIGSGIEVEKKDINFTKLNIDPNHPAHNIQDSFYIKDSPELLMRTHCTNMTVRRLLQEKSPTLYHPFAYLAIGDVYRRDDDDATHSHQFMQADGVAVDKNISMAHLKWTLNNLCRHLFGQDIPIRCRPSYFPFTEPSLEFDILCTICNGQKCSVCKYSGYIEVLGAGMINNEVFKRCHKDASWQGIAFGIGIERITMLKYHINDIRQLYLNDARFLKYFHNIKIAF